MSAKVLEENKFAVGDLVKITKEYVAYSWGGKESKFIGYIGRVESQTRVTKNGAIKWETVLILPDNVRLRVLTSYRFTDSPLLPVFKV